MEELSKKDLLAYDARNLEGADYLEIIETVVKYMAVKEIILDNGCGTGNFTKRLLEEGHTVYALDNNSIALEILQEKCEPYKKRLHTYCQNAETLPFSDEMFGGVVSTFVLQFVENPKIYLKECCRVLKKDGVLAIYLKEFKTGSHIDLSDVMSMLNGKVTIMDSGNYPEIGPYILARKIQ